MIRKMRLSGVRMTFLVFLVGILAFQGFVLVFSLRQLLDKGEERKAVWFLRALLTWIFLIFFAFILGARLFNILTIMYMAMAFIVGTYIWVTASLQVYYISGRQPKLPGKEPEEEQ